VPAVWALAAAGKRALASKVAARATKPNRPLYNGDPNIVISL